MQGSPHPRRRHRHGPRRAPARARRRASSPASTRRTRCSRSPAAGRPRKAWRVDVRARRRARAGLCGPLLRRRRSAFACSCTRRAWRTLRRRIVPRRRRARVADYPSIASVALAQSIVRRVTHALGARTEPYRVFSDREIAAAFAAHGFRIRSIHRQFVLPIAVHKAIGSRRFTPDVRAAAEAPRPAAPLRFAGHHRRRAVRVLVTGATGFTGGHLARALAAGGGDVRALVRDASAGRATWRPPAWRSSRATSPTPPPSRVRSRASRSSTTSRRSTVRRAWRRRRIGP